MANDAKHFLAGVNWFCPEKTGFWISDICSGETLLRARGLKNGVPKGIILKNTRLSVVVWNEFIHERQNPAIWSNHPEGLHSGFARALKRTAAFNAKATALDITTATQDQPEHGLSEARLETCDVLIWWGHRAHDEVSEGVVARVHRRVLEGMGLIVLHSGYSSKIFRRLLGANCTLKWRAIDEKERLCVVQPSHPIAAGLGELFELPAEEIYSESFDSAQPDSTVFASRIEGGEVFHSGCCWERGYGRLFYFRPGHINDPTCHDNNVQQILANAVQWVAPRFRFNGANPGFPKPQLVEQTNSSCAVYGENAMETSSSPDSNGHSLVAIRSHNFIAVKETPPPRQIESALLFPTLMNHLQQREMKHEHHKTMSDRFPQESLRATID